MLARECGGGGREPGRQVPCCRLACASSLAALGPEACARLPRRRGLKDRVHLYEWDLSGEVCPRRWAGGRGHGGKASGPWPALITGIVPKRCLPLSEGDMEMKYRFYVDE